MEKYTIMKKCKNCGGASWLSIPKGKSVEEYCLEEKLKCKNCGCDFYKEKEEK
jgi:rRNA maturation protein Nop10